MRVIVRCDSSMVIGSGHVMRCRNIGLSLQEQGMDVTFICRLYEGNLVELLKSDFNVFCLSLSSDEPGGACSENVQDNMHNHWLNYTQSKDVDDCLSVIEKSGLQSIDWFIVDHYSLDLEWEEKICQGIQKRQRYRPQVLVLDDLANRKHTADIVVDSGQLNDFNPYQSLVSYGCRSILGPRFAPIGTLYGKIHSAVPIRTRLQRILVFFGAADEDGYTLETLEALCTDDFKDIDVDIVLNKQSRQYSITKMLALKRPRTQLYSGLPTLAGLMLRADFAIGSAGVTSWERACMGLPALVFMTASNQKQNIKTLLASRAAVVVADPEMNLELRETVQREIRFLMSDPSLLSDMSARAKELCDGQGVSRIIKAMREVTPE